MSDSFNKQFNDALSQRGSSAKAMKRGLDHIGTIVKTETGRVTDGTVFKELIEEHPFIATGAALGAGLLACKLVKQTLSSTPANHPQHVVIRVEHGAVTAANAAPPTPPGSSIMDFVTKAIAGYETAQNFLRPYINKAREASDRVDAAMEPQVTSATNSSSIPDDVPIRL